MGTQTVTHTNALPVNQPEIGPVDPATTVDTATETFANFDATSGAYGLSTSAYFTQLTDTVAALVSDNASNSALMDIVLADLRTRKVIT